MICQECGTLLAEGAEFCVHCGTKAVPMVCKHCGTKIENNSKFCAKCGMRTWLPVSDEQINTTQQNSSGDQDSTVEQYGPNAIKSFWVSVSGTILSLIIRLSSQEIYYSWSNLLENRKVLGLDEDTKPFLTIIPIAVAVIISLLLTKDTISSMQKKKVAFIVNAIFVALSVLFIWFDIPYNIIDF